MLPLLLAGIVSGFVVASITRPGQAAALVAASVRAGLAAVAVAQAWLEALGGSWLANAGVLSLIVLATASVAAGLTALLGRRGVIVAALLMVLFGNPWSGVSSAPEPLPRPIGDFGQLPPPGAGANALRGTAFFDGAGSGEQLLVTHRLGRAGTGGRGRRGAARAASARRGRARGRRGPSDLMTVASAHARREVAAPESGSRTVPDTVTT